VSDWFRVARRWPHHADPAHPARRQENRIRRAAWRGAENPPGRAAGRWQGERGADQSFVAETLALAKSAVSLKSGQTSRRKVLEVQGAKLSSIEAFASGK
jgi:hypothetical protein